MTPVVLTLVGSFATGVLGGILGAGGGIFLVPYLIFVVGVRPISAVGISIFCVLGTSVGATSRALKEGRVNVSLALALEPFLVVGATLAAFFAQRVSDRTLLALFALLMLGLALLLFATRRSVVEPVAHDDAPGRFDGIVVERAGDDAVVYRPRRVPWLLGLSTLAGASSGLFGIGGGALVVPLLTFVARVPMRAATSTSAFTMAMTGASAAVVHLVHGTVPAALVAASLVGVVPGGRVGARLQRGLSEEKLRLTFAFFACVIAALTLSRAIEEGA